MIARWLFGDAAQLPHWTPQRAAQAERDTLRAQGVVVEPHWTWSRPAQERERLARQRRMQRAAGQPKDKAQGQTPRRATVTPMRGQR